MNDSKQFPLYARWPFERSEQMQIDITLRSDDELIASVELDGNLLNLSIRNNFETFVNTTLIIPHIRGVSGIVWNGGEDGYVFFIRVADSKGFKVNTGWLHNQAYREHCKETLIDVRHRVLAILNEYYHRPYCGEQLKLFRN